MRPAFVVLDLETTGTNPLIEDILEIGMTIVDRELVTIASLALVMPYSGIEFDPTTNTYEPPFGIHKDVVDMHKASDLWQDCYRCTHTEMSVWDYCTKWLEKHLHDGEKLPLLGSTIGFDRSFLLVHNEEFLNLFHYRSVDVTSIKLLYNEWVAKIGVPEDQPPPGNKLHRVLPDCLDTINELKFYRRRLFNG